LPEQKGKHRPEGEKPLGPWMPGSLAEFETLILERRVRLHNNPVLISACMSVVTEQDPFGNRWLSKRRATNRIDAAVAACMAVGAMMTGEVWKPDVKTLIA
jgi:phage terminase large subunit-like protein